MKKKNTGNAKEVKISIMRNSIEKEESSIALNPDKNLQTQINKQLDKPMVKTDKQRKISK